MSRINEETCKGEMKQMSTRKHWPDLSSSSLSEDEKASILLVLSIGRAFKSIDEYVRPRMRLLGHKVTQATGEINPSALIFVGAFGLASIVGAVTAWR